ncbi:hypothetical protein Sru01_22310 [Sphaerisporangium rufum]|uniref:Uncharacterized protein n=1 Tax=Sphaerisporangium rufum TaxID=1381558 RepID=A0A919UYY8_9ACTN|nr:DUF6326 family protein [Sphaerisporangium rufum]GII77249.1 hypothetical protein Sru01_22310 [Sphaerisporangium rufum]
MKNTLSALWIFVMFNYLYCDLFDLMDPAQTNPFEVTPGFLLAAAALMEIPITATLVSFLAPYRPNRWTNIGAGSVMTLVQIWSLTVAPPTGYYLAYSVVEASATALIAVLAWRWAAPAAAPAEAPANPRRARPPGRPSS